MADASPRRANRYRQVEADYEKPEVTLERLERIMTGEIAALGLILEGRDAV